MNTATILEETAIFEYVDEDEEEEISVIIPTFLDYLKEEGKKGSTVLLYGKILFKFQEKYHFSIASLTMQDVIDHLKTIGGRGSWKKVVILALKKYYNWLVDIGYRPDNPIEKIKPPKPKVREYLPLTPQEFTRIRDAAKLPIRDLLIHLRWTGLRIQEALDSIKSDYLLDRVDADGNPAPEMLVRDGKGGTNIYVPLINPKHVAWLRRRLFNKAPDDNLFNLTYNQAWYGIHHAAARAGVQYRVYDEEGQNRYYVTPHSIRRFFATWALRSGYDITMVQRMLRHKDISTTMRYAKADNDMIRLRTKELRVANG